MEIDSDENINLYETDVYGNYWIIALLNELSKIQET